MMESGQRFESKRVFFLYPHSVLKDEMIKEIISHEYEIYFVFDHEKIKRVLRRYSDSILYINIDEALSLEEWEKYILNFKGSSGLDRIKIGVLTYNSDNDVQRRLLTDFPVECGYVRLSLGLAESTGIILKTLEVNEVKGRRKYVRAKGEVSNTTSCNITISGKDFTGTILDISSAGMACQFDRSPGIRLRTVLTDIQLKLKGVLCRVNGIVGAIREDSSPVLIIMFDQSMRPEVKHKIGHYVFRRLQETISDEMK